MSRPLRRGFTILEILITLVVLAIGLLGVMALVPPSVKSAATTSRRVLASQHARAVVASLRQAAVENCFEVRADGGDRDFLGCFLVLQHPAFLRGAPLSPRLEELLNGTRRVLSRREVPLELLEEPSCIVLPQGSDAALIYPRPRDSRRCEVLGQGDERLVPDNVYLEPEDWNKLWTRAVYPLGPSAGASGAGPPPAVDPPGFSFALEVQRAGLHGVAQDGIYSVNVHIYHDFRPPLPPYEEPPEHRQRIHTYTTLLRAGFVALGHPPREPEGP